MSEMEGEVKALLFSPLYPTPGMSKPFAKCGEVKICYGQPFGLTLFKIF